MIKIYTLDCFMTEYWVVMNALYTEAESGTNKPPSAAGDCSVSKEKYKLIFFFKLKFKNSERDSTAPIVTGFFPA